jgi:branched-chain amino acid transport system permease protein
MTRNDSIPPSSQPAPEARPPQGRAGVLMSAVVPVVAVFLLAAILHYVAGPLLAPYPRRILVDIGVTIILAVSLNIVNGYTGQFSIGHAAFMAAGGYVAAGITFYVSLLIWDMTPSRAPTDVLGQAIVNGITSLSQSLPGGPWHLDAPAGVIGPGELLLAGACVVGGIVAAALGWLVGLPSLRLRGDYLAIVTLGFGEILRVLLQQTNPQLFYKADLQIAGWRQLVPPPLGGAQGFADTPKVTGLFWTYLFVGITVLFAYRLKLSSYGRALLSIREDEIAAEAMGVNTTKLKIRAFTYAALFAGIAGGLYAHQLGNALRPVDAGFLRSFDIIIIVVLGGLGSISGAVLAAIVLTILGAALTDLAEYRMIPYALALIILMIFRPQGLFGVHEIWDVVGRLWHRFFGRRGDAKGRGFPV